MKNRRIYSLTITFIEPLETEKAPELIAAALKSFHASEVKVEERDCGECVNCHAIYFRRLRGARITRCYCSAACRVAAHRERKAGPK